MATSARIIPTHKQFIVRQRWQYLDGTFKGLAFFDTPGEEVPILWRLFEGSEPTGTPLRYEPGLFRTLWMATNSEGLLKDEDPRHFEILCV